jgi:hypothetical protein
MALGAVHVSASAVSSTCPSELKQLEVMRSTLDQLMSRREVDGEKAMLLWRLVREIGSELNYGSRDDLGERLTFSLFFLDEKAEAFVLERLTKLETLAASPRAFAPLAKAASELSQVLRERNLYRDREWTPEKLACLAGADFTEALSLDQKFSLERLSLETLRKNPDLSSSIPVDFDSRIDSAVRHEENIWPDTILEGEVGQNGPATASDIEIIVQGGKLLAVELTIRAPAVFTGNGDCRYNDRRRQWVGQGCAHGEISVRKTLNHRLELVGSMDFAEFDN